MVDFYKLGHSHRYAHRHTEIDKQTHTNTHRYRDTDRQIDKKDCLKRDLMVASKFILSLTCYNNIILCLNLHFITLKQLSSKHPRSSSGQPSLSVSKPQKPLLPI